MTEVTYVSYVPKGKRAKLRQVLESEDTGSVRWSEKKKLFGSEFYFSGPTQLVRRTHAYITAWLAADDMGLK
ncbi:hypothetical protein LJR225_002782 [Phenylobacterium sp. LjRoot225]|uniref:hypothetical protein n=1 Tax=Phenylobacterium sp. LjRoot225 TaxID=3342285 RepID=UPI003ED01FB0